MKKNIVNGFIIFAVGLLAPQILQAQGTVYVSNLGQGIGEIGVGSVGSNSWLAAGFNTGSSFGGYMLNSVQLEMGNAFGSPSGFTALIYAANAAINPGSMIGTLSGSSDPATGGIYTYAPAANLTLSPSTLYFIVLTAGTPFFSGAAGPPLGYEWNSGPNYNSVGGWIGADGSFFSSNYGLSWNSVSGNYLQYAIDATAIPEPGVLSLLGLGGLGFLWQRRRL